MTARILDCSPDEYHDLPGFRSSTAKVLLDRSPLHARSANGKRPSDVMDFGNVMHRLVLGAGKSYAVLAYDDWRTKAAKEARDAARSRGLVPILEEKFDQASRLAESIVAKLAHRGIVLDGISECPVEWTEKTEHGDVLCHAMFDHVWLSTGAILDLKITEDAAPLAVERTAENLGYAVQSAAYTRAITALKPELAGRVEFLFAFCEPADPFAINICRPDGVFRELGDRRWMRAVNTWGRCMKTNAWPSYGTTTNYINPPQWALAREGYSTEDRR